jgi:uncharacterized protein (DUF1800 family)
MQLSDRLDPYDASPIDNIDSCSAPVGDAGPAHPLDDGPVPRPPLDRRSLLRTAGLAALAGAAAAVTIERPPALAQTAPPPAMRRGHQDLWAAGGAAGVEAPPAPEIVALNRMGFGPRPGDLDALMALGSTSAERLAAYVEQQLNPAAIDDSACEARLTALNLTTLAKPLAQLWQDHNRKEGLDWNERMRPANETLTATFIRAVYSKRQLVEVLADFWHNHFNVYGYDFWSGTTWVHYDRDVIRANMLQLPRIP